MSSLQQRICRQSKPLLKRLRPRQGLFTFLIFLVLSGFFWLSTALNGYYDYEVDFPVVIDGMPANLVRTSDSVDVVRVMIHDKGYAILQFTREHNISPLSFSFPGYNKQSNKCVISSSELQKLVAKRLPGSAAISSIKPEKIEFSYIEGVPKSVPVRLIGSLMPATNYYLAHTQIQPSRVTVYAAADKIDSIQYVVTENLNVKNFSDTVRNKVGIKTKPATKAVPDEVSVVLYPDVLTEEEVEVPVTAINVPDSVILRTFPSRVKVRFTVGASMYRTVSASQFKVTVDYDEIDYNAEKCKISIARTPSGVKQSALETDEVDFLIEN